MTWQIKKLGEVCEIGAGNSAPQKKEMFTDGVYPFFRTSDVGKIHLGFIEDSADKLNDLGIRKLQLYKKGTLLFPKSGASTFLNHRVLMNADGYVSSHLATLKARNILDDRFLLYFSMTVDARNLMQDQNYPSLRLSDIQEIKILLPPLPEQQRIVAILDETLAAIATAKENAEKNLQNARELFESYLQSVFANPGDGWEERTLGEIVSFSQGIQVGLEKHLIEPKEGYVRFIRIIDYTQNTSDVRYIPNPGNKYFVNEDDIVMVRYGTPGLIGRGKAGVIANNLFKITVERNDLVKDYLCLYLSQKHIQTYLSTQGSATEMA